MKYDELSDKAKARARQEQAEYDTAHDWYRDVYEDAKRMGDIIGLEIGWSKNKAIDISFSGFWSQGDGCCWTGYLATKKFVGAVAAIQAETSDEYLLELAKEAEVIHERLVVHQVSNRLTVPEPEPEYTNEENWHYPDCIPGIRVGIDGNERYWQTRVNEYENFSNEFATLFNELAESFAKWIYDSLEKEYEYLIDDKRLEAEIREYDPDFDEGGNEI